MAARAWGEQAPEAPGGVPAVGAEAARAWEASGGVPAAQAWESALAESVTAAGGRDVGAG
ncbi:MAG: hypothetical protein HY712_02985 [candidate division NC10 bacterium]|nr:hypothetical protein [candidate division NC10 bacterium]